jgi:hypothetical protein
MAKATQSHRTEITVALIGFLGVLGGALFANWDKMFSNGAKPANPVASKYIVSITFFPELAEDSKKIAKVLDAQGYITNLTLAGKDIAHEENTPSYIYFKDEGAQSEALRVRETISAVLNRRLNLFADPKMDEKQLNVILTQAN